MDDQVKVRPAGITVAHTYYVLRFPCESRAGNQYTREDNQETLDNSFHHDAPSLFSSVFSRPFCVKRSKREWKNWGRYAQAECQPGVLRQFISGWAKISREANHLYLYLRNASCV